jgi:cell division transport system ATP-binding protein
MIDEGYKKSIIQLFHVYKRYGEKLALADITVDIGKNEFVFISGPSGAGKSTLLKLLYLGERVNQGNIIVDGVNLSRIPDKKIPGLRRKFGIIFQDYKLIPTKTVYENISLVLQAVGKHRKQIQQRVANVLRIVGMKDRWGAYPPELSGGEQQRVAVARAVCADPKIILADEPTGNLDSRSAAIILNLLIQFHTRGATVIMATHNVDMVKKKGGRILNLKDGRLESISFLDSPRNLQK